MMTKIALNNLKMNVIQTAPNGVVNDLTIFTFSQADNFISASYAGGQIFKGYLVGTLHNDKLLFSYCQLQNDGKMDNGQSECALSIGGNGKIRLTEHFEFASRENGQGINVFQEL